MKYKNTNTHFQVNYRNENKSGAIGIISGAVSPQNRIKIEEMEVFFDYAAKTINESDRKFGDLGEFIISKYDAFKYTPDLKVINIFKASVIMNHFPNVITREQINNKQHEEEQNIEGVVNLSFFNQAKEYSPEELDLNFKFYRIKILSRCNVPKYTLIKLEEKTESIEIENDKEGKLSIDLLLFLGVSKADIASKNNRFKAYALMMRDLGDL